jgi:hypothetical protein
LSVCTRCGHELDPASVGRFCTNCGHPIGAPVEEADWRTGTAERPAVPADDTAQVPVTPAAPPSPHTAPLEPARFPLYADEVGDAAGPVDTGPPPPPTVPPLPLPEQIAPEPADPTSHRRAPWWPWLVAAVVLVVVAVLGYRLLLSTGDGTSPTAEETTQSGKGPDKKPTKEPSGGPSKDKKPDKPKPGKSGDVAPSAKIDVPATAPPNQDLSGDTVTYEAANMVDGRADTCWRMPGDGTGSTITFTLPQETEVKTVGMINGYAKSAGNLDWYAGNRRVVKATWEFDDGTVIEQDLAETRDLQTLQLDPVTTTTVRLTLTEVSKPGSGPEARNYTAISQVSLVGTPQ